MGILAGFISGTARAAAQIADQRIARYTAEELQRQRDLMEQEREKRLEEAQIAKENRAIAQREKDRIDTTKRIDTEATGLIDSAIQQKRGLIDMNMGDRSTWTPEQQAAVEQALAEDRKAMSNDLGIRYQASVNTGDTSLQNAVLVQNQERRLDIQEKKNDEQTKYNNARLDKQDEWNRRQDEIRNKYYAIQEARAARAEKNKNIEMDKAELHSTRLSLQSVLKDLATQEDKLQTQAASPMISPEQQAIIAKKLERLDLDRIEVRNSLLELGGMKKPEKGSEVDSFDAKIDQKLNQVRGGNQSQPATSPVQSSTARAPVDNRKPLEEPKKIRVLSEEEARANIRANAGNTKPEPSVLSSFLDWRDGANKELAMRSAVVDKIKKGVGLTPEEAKFARENNITVR